jgi:hypothetical protein
MKAVGSILALVIVLAIIWFVIKSQFASGPAGGQPPKEVIDVVGVKSDLLAELQQDGAITFSGANRRGYSYTAEVDGGEHFKITAAPSDPAKIHWPTLSIDETMEVAQQ